MEKMSNYIFNRILMSIRTRPQQIQNFLPRFWGLRDSEYVGILRVRDLELSGYWDNLGIFDDFFLFIERICMKAISKIINREIMQPELLHFKLISIVFFPAKTE